MDDEARAFMGTIMGKFTVTIIEMKLELDQLTPLFLNFIYWAPKELVDILPIRTIF